MRDDILGDQAFVIGIILGMVGMLLAVWAATEPVEAKINLPEIVQIMERKDKTYQFELVPTGENGRRIYCEDIAFGPEWVTGGIHKPVARAEHNIVWPQIHAGRIIVTMRHVVDQN